MSQRKVFNADDKILLSLHDKLHKQNLQFLKAESVINLAKENRQEYTDILKLRDAIKVEIVGLVKEISKEMLLNDIRNNTPVKDALKKEKFRLEQQREIVQKELKKFKPVTAADIDHDFMSDFNNAKKSVVLAHAPNQENSQDYMNFIKSYIETNAPDVNGSFKQNYILPGVSEAADLKYFHDILDAKLTEKSYQLYPEMSGLQLTNKVLTDALLFIDNQIGEYKKIQDECRVHREMEWTIKALEAMRKDHKDDVLFQAYIDSTIPRLRLVELVEIALQKLAACIDALKPYLKKQDMIKNPLRRNVADRLNKVLNESFASLSSMDKSLNEKLIIIRQLPTDGMNIISDFKKLGKKEDVLSSVMKLFEIGIVVDLQKANQAVPAMNALPNVSTSMHTTFGKPAEPVKLVKPDEEVVKYNLTHGHGNYKKP